MVNDEKETNSKTVTVSIELPEPPEGYGEIEWRQPSRQNDMYLSCNMKWQIMGNATFTGMMFVARKLHKFPQNAVGTFYPAAGGSWGFTDEQVEELSTGLYRAIGLCLPATVFSDFVPPPDRRPYRVKNGVEVKDGGK